ncbi:hypothetical protein [Kineothrix sedimenti]|uniref:Chloramphenicol acetyltransferase n=1 Tax=Kineothrix sedimenti TaxID=3123317 RepID=A0ABZ3EU13_9FIRM
MEYEFCRTSHTVMKADGTYAYCEADPTLSFERFVEETSGNQEKVLASGGLEEEGRLMLPVSVLAHHALIDGRHIADFYESLSQGLVNECFI